MYTVHCTLYIVHCTMYNVHCIQCTLYNGHCTLYNSMYTNIPHHQSSTFDIISSLHHPLLSPLYINPLLSPPYSTIYCLISILLVYHLLFPHYSTLNYILSTQKLYYHLPIPPLYYLVSTPLSTITSLLHPLPINVPNRKRLMHFVNTR